MLGNGQYIQAPVFLMIRKTRDELSGKQQVMAGTSELLQELSQLSNAQLVKKLATVAKVRRKKKDFNDSNSHV